MTEGMCIPQPNQVVLLQVGQGVGWHIFCIGGGGVFLVALGWFWGEARRGEVR